MAETVESSKEDSVGSEVAMTERDFEPALGQDVDDEATIDEEETLEEREGFNHDELQDLQKDAEVPIEDLLALYYNPSNEQGDHVDNGEDENAHVALDDIQPEPLPPYDDHAEEMQQNGVDISPRQSPISQDSPQSHPASPSQSSSVNPPENQRITRGLAAAYQYYPESDSSSSDEDYSPAEDWKKEIHIGPDHQAEVPETTCPDTDEDEKHDSKCLWSPKGITEQALQKYVDTVCGSGWDGGTSCVMSKGDDEQALYVLLQCNYNCEEAIKKFTSQSAPSQGTEEMTFWSEEECRNFELGLRQFGKDFYSIQHSKIPGRTVGDIVQFYYLWKKTERHDAFSWQIRNKKKYSFHPGITDYMDRFLDENESAASSRAGSPGRAHIPQSNAVTDDARANAMQTTTENVVVNRPTSNEPHYTSSSTATMMSGLLRIPQSYVPTPVIVSNDKEPPAKKPNLGNSESLIVTNGPPPLKPHDNAVLQIPQITGHVSNHATMTTSHSTSHMTNHMMHVPSQLTTGINATAPTTNLSSAGLPFSSLNTQHLNLHNIDSGNTYTRLTQNI